MRLRTHSYNYAISGLVNFILYILTIIAFIFSLSKFYWYKYLFNGILATLMATYIAGYIFDSIKDDTVIYFSIPFLQMIGIVSAIILIFSYF